ncbi:ABC transporter substrate-binding protein [Paenibacillus sp. 32O-W]|uniref:ABC transporter substrate-binding protein n=1 Tax=Paenibacillus sp. 32O-W TaxID=1695218 RepID=UPI00071F0EC0|nr:ABC transporter substrate-binding protein [Paenibacillus sp. 32O-W]ALS28583.1 ABC transporter substrate-binding protein [Paenibacillus sp. 32O-W]
MPRKSKAVMLLLSSLLILSLVLAGCGKSNNAGESEASATASGGGGSAPNNEKPLELTLAFIGIGNMKEADLVQEEISKITKAKINATVKLMPIDVGAWTQQVNLLLSGNEKLDLLVTSSFFNYSAQVAKGQLLPLDELLEKYAPGIKDTMEPAIYNSTKIGGKIYGVPSIRDTAFDVGFIARKDLMDKHNLSFDNVKTFADLEPIFQTIKEKEPGVYPIVQRSQTTAVAWELVNGYVDWLGDTPGALLIDNQDLKVVNIYEQPIYKEALQLTRKWYQAGYIMQDAATTQETNNSLIKAGKGFGYFSNMKPGFENQEKNLNGTEMVAVRITKPISASNAGTGFMLSIPKNTQDPERAMQLMNLLYTDKDIVNLLANGIEGKHYVSAGDNLIKPPAGESGYTFNQWQIGNNALAKVWEGTPPDIWEQTKAFNKSATFSKALGFTFDAGPVKTEVAAVTNVNNQFKAGLESGTVDPSKLDDFLSKLKSAGLDKIIAEKQKQLDEWAKANNIR